MDGHLLCCLDAVNKKKVKNIIEVYFESLNPARKYDLHC